MKQKFADQAAQTKIIVGTFEIFWPSQVIKIINVMVQCHSLSHDTLGIIICPVTKSWELRHEMPSQLMKKTGPK